MLALETGHQFPSLRGLLKKDVFQICGPILIMGTEVDDLVG
jgi:hypothetical protein